MGQLTVPQHANHVWALDHKGWIRLGDGCRVEPFTVTDGFSRYLISLAATGSTQYAECRPPLERAFREYGLPQIIRSDNGSPFASTGTTGLTALSVWWIKLGIRHERIDPGHPQQNGRHERMHRTLKDEATKPASKNFLQQQARFDEFLTTFNQERPHEAINMRYPAELYSPSPRPYGGLPELEYPFHDRTITVTRCGRICMGPLKINLSQAFAGQRVGLKQVEEKNLAGQLYAL